MAKSKKSGQAVLAQMNTNLLSEYNTIRDTITKLTKNDLLGRHQLGAKFEQILTDKSKYGDKSAHLLAEALGVKANYIYTHARVAKTWSHGDVEEITKTKPCVSFSHLIHISTVPDAKKRKVLIDEVQSFDLAVDATISKVKEVVRKSKPDQKDEARSPASAIKKSQKLCKALTDWQEEFELLVFDVLTDSPADHASEELVSKLSELSAAFTDLQELAKGNKVKIQACVDACQKVLDAEPIDGGDFETDGDDMPISDLEEDDSSARSAVLAGIKKGLK